VISHRPADLLKWQVFSGGSNRERIGRTGRQPHPCQQRAGV